MQLEKLAAMGAAFNPNLYKGVGPKMLIEVFRDSVVEVEKEAQTR